MCMQSMDLLQNTYNNCGLPSTQWSPIGDRAHWIPGGRRHLGSHGPHRDKVQSLGHRTTSALSIGGAAHLPYLSTQHSPPAPSPVVPVPSGRGSPASMERIWRSTIPRHLHPELPAVQHGSVHGVHRILSIPLIVEANKSEAAALLGVTVTRDIDIAHTAVLLKHSSQGLWGGSVGQVIYFKGRHIFNIRRRPPVTHSG